MYFSRQASLDENAFENFKDVSCDRNLIRSRTFFLIISSLSHLLTALSTSLLDFYMLHNLWFNEIFNEIFFSEPGERVQHAVWSAHTAGAIWFLHSTIIRLLMMFLMPPITQAEREHFRRKIMCPKSWTFLINFYVYKSHSGVFTGCLCLGYNIQVETVEEIEDRSNKLGDFVSSCSLSRSEGKNQVLQMKREISASCESQQKKNL